MKTEFTPGPWQRNDGVSVFTGLGALNRDYIPAPKDDGYFIAYCGEDERLSYKENRANARLIAAAPDLYAVLSELEESCEYWSEYDVPLGMVDRIKSALKRARGEQ